MAPSSLITGLLLLSLTGSRGLRDFPKHFVVAKRNSASPVALTCNRMTSGPVTWKLHGEVVDEYYALQDGQNLILSEVHAPMLGEYSCWKGTEKLSSTFLLMEADEEDEIDSFLRCRAKSYDCSFSCMWTGGKYTAVRLGLGHECTDGQKSCKWVSSSDQQQNQFVLTHSRSPYAEESTELEVTVEAIENFHFLKRTKLLFLRDIVIPDSPQIIRCEEVDQHLNVTVDPPSSWSTPHTFFSLEHEIEYMFRDDGRTERSSSTLIPKSISRLRVRSRDPLVLSAWSQWTPWKNVRNGKRNPCRLKKRKQPCCNNLPPKSKDCCKNRKKIQRTRNN
nr:interleukin-12 subunit beta isoform X1 [Nothobranchius furzeri]XP_054587613.1 interleukin-12 subunit beta isoform X1 [Nothobranchius furzeri]